MVLLKFRKHTPEILDGREYSDTEFEETLKQLGTVNFLTNTHSATRRALQKVAQLTNERPLRILDIGFGYGDGLRSLARFAVKKNIEVELHGIELNPKAIELARKVKSPLPIKFSSSNVFDLKLDQPYHLIMSTQVMHHLRDEEIVKLLKWMTKNSSVGWFINDLHRHWMAYLTFKPLMKLLGFNRIIQNDGKLSIARGFKRQEWMEFIKKSNLDSGQVCINWHWAFRYGIFFKIKL